MCVHGHTACLIFIKWYKIRFLCGWVVRRREGVTKIAYTHTLVCVCVSSLLCEYNQLPVSASEQGRVTHRCIHSRFTHPHFLVLNVWGETRLKNSGARGVCSTIQNINTHTHTHTRSIFIIRFDLSRSTRWVHIVTHTHTHSRTHTHTCHVPRWLLRIDLLCHASNQSALFWRGHILWHIYKRTKTHMCAIKRFVVVAVVCILLWLFMNYCTCEGFLSVTKFFN